MHIAKLTERAIRQKTKRGYYNDGGGLYLRVAVGGSKSWVFRFKADGRPREMGLGPVATLGLKEAREKAREARQLRLDGIDPIDQRQAKRATARGQARRVMTFRQCAEAYIAAHQDSWKNPKHRTQWPNSLAAYAYPVFGDMPVDAVDLDLVVKALEPIWKTKTETASRVRGRIEAVLDWAAVRKFRQGDNPARWRGHLQKLFARKKEGVHHAALPYGEVAVFLEVLRKQEGTAARALHFAILTAGRSGEVLGIRWDGDEIDLDEQVWTIPASRMKAGKEHRVPLSKEALAIIAEQQKVREGDFVFAGNKAGRPLGPNAMTSVLRRIGRTELTVHGFRSTFRDWAAEQTNFPREVCEMALAHTVSDKVEAAYRRGDMFQKRRQLMTAWGQYCAMPVKSGETVVALQRR
jgi:integrase